MQELSPFSTVPPGDHERDVNGVRELKPVTFTSRPQYAPVEVNEDAAAEVVPVSLPPHPEVPPAITEPEPTVVPPAGLTLVPEQDAEPVDAEGKVQGTPAKD